jgi:hypothetical protein
MIAVLFNCNALSDDELVDRIIIVLLKEYSNYKNRTAMEKIVLMLSKKPYIESLDEWEKNYRNLPVTRIKLNRMIEKAVVSAEKYLPVEKGGRFRSLFENLIMIKDRIKNRLSFYSFAFNFLDGIWAGIVKKDLEISRGMHERVSDK